LIDHINQFGTILLSTGNCKVRGCEFIHLFCNSSNNGAALSALISGGKTFVVENSKFINCRGAVDEIVGGAGHGGGIYAEGYNNDHSGKLIVVGCEFSFCSGYDGGGVCVKGCQSEFDDCIFTDCSSYSWGGGISVNFWGNHNFSRCIFVRCSARKVYIFFFFLK
jgi:hypothetical protein